ncbi:RNA methyltransferase [Erysipelothrix rhusiopathiae]|uniref:TrmH family RNA methyltransferase n=1 Tax=Erysipelothrix rhusiopathiae TaxID=1648 RepID=UPI000F436314|nr:RNA methyltransferase [Erysipelothrix rhusiopathiae]AYV35304.1 RNA methyltransferase [Erysipelothrix rhusiopathiae]MDE8082265.1 RNA methyltransferase [Erysipelothrix rhusiopathiae]MDE8315193.1 RNA methyltransferase [Erysipelothrix rhusiopathiae]MDE8330068.1 RNA methyltransferase [Erysipelothrix rhusiopathiae]MDE8333205.1 RNA methyltransferase [Erysipelothrix rhusiopathiae]
MIVSGKISVKAILKERKRDIEYVAILDKHNDKESRYVERIAEGLKIKRMSREEMDALATNKTHGGYIVSCGKRISDPINYLPKQTLSLMCIEGVTDPFNLGEICRTVASLGFDGIITPSYDFYEHEAKLIRASAGASESLWWMQSDDLSSDLKAIKAKKVVMAAAHRGDESESLLTYKLPERVCICLGGALRGLSKSVLDMCDVNVRIDYDARVSLSSVGACSVFAYERYRQLEEKK